MSLFGKNYQAAAATPSPVPQSTMPTAMILALIQDGVIITDPKGCIRIINPAAMRKIGTRDGASVLGLDVALCVRLERADGSKLDEAQNPFLHAIRTNQRFKSRDFTMISRDGDKKIPVELDVAPANNPAEDRIIILRDIEKKREEENAQSEFIYTASHEMRTPVASIEGYLGLALNPQTATIDQRAKGYLEAAHAASQHLGRLFQDLLDVTKLDDGKVQPRLIPLELTSFVKKIAEKYIDKFKEKKLSYFFGVESINQSMRTFEQPVYTFSDADFVEEIVSNLIENAIKYTPAGKSVRVNVQGDGKRAVISVIDTGIGISSDDLPHLFQKFYRADNSDTREIGGTGLGLYIVKQRAEAMGGKVWAESVFGSGSTFSVALPRITADEYEKRRIALKNQPRINQNIVK